MDYYCTRCGASLKESAAYCAHCGAPVSARRHTAELNAAAELLASGSLTLAKGFAALLLGMLGSVTALAGAAMLATAVYLLYHFAAGTAVTLPWLFAGALTGAPLVAGGLMSVFIAALLGAAAGAIFRCLHDFRHPHHRHTVPGDPGTVVEAEEKRV